MSCGSFGGVFEVTVHLTGFKLDLRCLPRHHSSTLVQYCQWEALSHASTIYQHNFTAQFIERCFILTDPRSSSLAARVRHDGAVHLCTTPGPDYSPRVIHGSRPIASLYELVPARAIRRGRFADSQDIDKAAIPVELKTAKERAKSFDMRSNEKGKTTGWKRCRSRFIQLYLARLADCIAIDSEPEGPQHVGAEVDAAVTLRAVLMGIIMELMYNSDVFLALQDFDPMIRVA
ncbi:hypothetical protein C8R45DRAFT_920350 [Mycena sanguinolenta]|nr:hypothetical protein C8R45DRAFT_920350 [Mycena sanguinolenta]